MRRSEYDRVVENMVQSMSCTYEQAVGVLRRAGTAPEADHPMSVDFGNTQLALGLTMDDRPLVRICEDLGWDHYFPSTGANNIEYVAQGLVTNLRRLVLVQFEEDGEPVVHLYSYDLVDPGRWWQLDVPQISAESGR